MFRLHSSGQPFHVRSLLRIGLDYLSKYLYTFSACAVWAYLHTITSGNIPMNDTITVQMSQCGSQLRWHHNNLNGGQCTWNGLLQKQLEIAHAFRCRVEQEWCGMILNRNTQYGQNVWMGGIVQAQTLLQQQRNLHLASMLGNSLDKHILTVIVSATVDTAEGTLLQQTR